MPLWHKLQQSYCSYGFEAVDSRLCYSLLRLSSVSSNEEGVRVCLGGPGERYSQVSSVTVDVTESLQKMTKQFNKMYASASMYKA